MLENPFPGMNPYMEDPHLWQMVHHRIISAIDSELNAVLPDEYVTRIEERVYVEGWRQSFRPDNVVVQTEPMHGDRDTGGKRGVTVIERTAAHVTTFDAPLTLEWFPSTVREPFVEIRTSNDQEELVAVIEVLSPTNKAEGGGRDEYQHKQQKILHSWVHLLEIDLLRGGQYSIAPDENALREHVPTFDYIISLHRGGRGAVADVWAVQLSERLPRIGLPLAGDEPFIPLDLQEVVNRACSEGGIAKNLLRSYKLPPNPPLGTKDVAWVDSLLRERGLR